MGNSCFCLICVKDAKAQCLVSHADWVDTWKDCINGMMPDKKESKYPFINLANNHLKLIKELNARNLGK